MPLRYLQLQTPNYVPSYNTLDTNLINTVDSAISQQGQQFNERRDLFDVAASNATKEFSTLGDRDQQYAQDEFTRSRERINQIVEEQGARNALPFLNEEVSRITNELAPLRQASQQKAQAIEMLSENDKLPTDVKQEILNQEIGGDYDEQGRLIGIKGGYNQRDLNIAANWEDWTSDVQSFVSNMNASSTEGLEFEVSPEETAKYRKKLKRLGFDEISTGAVSFLMSNPKYREQLQLLGKTEIGAMQREYERRVANGEDAIIPPSINSKGEVVAKMTKPLLDTNGQPIIQGEDENGKPIYKTENVTQTFDSVAAYKASEIGSTYGHQSFFELSYENVKEIDAGENQGTSAMTRFTSREGLPMQEQTFPEYMESVFNKAEGFNKRYDGLKKRFNSPVKALFGEEADYSIDDETGEVNIVLDGTSYTLDQLYEDEKLGDQQYNKFKDYEVTLRSTKNQARSFERDMDFAKSGIKNQLASKYPELEDFILENIDVSDSGGIEVRDPDNQENVTEVWKGSKVRGMHFKDGENRALRNFRQSNNRTALLNLKGTQITSAGTGAPGTEVSVDKMVYVSKNADGSLSYHNIKDSVRQDIENVSKEVVDRVTGQGRYDVASMPLNPENDLDKAIMKTVENNISLGTEMGEGQLTDKNGNEITFAYNEGMRFNPQETFVGKDGNGVIAGTMHHKDGGDEQYVYWNGETPTSILQAQLGNEYHKIMADRALENVLPRVYEEGGTTLGTAELISIGAFIKKDGKIESFDNIDIGVKKSDEGGSVTTDYFIKIPGYDRDFWASDRQELANIIRQKTEDKFK